MLKKIGFIILIIFQSLMLAQAFSVSGEIYFKKTGNIIISLRTRTQLENEEKGKKPLEYLKTIVLMINKEDLKTKKLKFEILDVSKGEHCIECYQDVNGNNKLDIGAFGPSEPWGYSMLKKKPAFRGPIFDEVKFDVTNDISSMKIIVD